MTIRPRHKASPASVLLLSLIAPVLSATAQTSESTTLAEGRTLYKGDTARIGVGTSGGGQFMGELGGVLKEQADQTWLGEGWVAGSARGLKISHHRLDQDTVHKYFVAHDQNATSDQKLTLGYGQERENWFGNINLSTRTSGKRLLNQQSSNVVTQQTGSVDNVNYTDTITQTTTTRLYEEAYRYGLGMRAGHYIDSHAIRLMAGLDHEWGRGSARQNTVSLTAEKFFVGTPHSIALQLSHRHKSGSEDIGNANDSRAMLVYRLSLGGSNSRPERLYKVSPAPATASPAAPVEVKAASVQQEKRWVKTRATMNSDAFFEFDSARLTPAAQAELARIAAVLQKQGREGNIQIIGHTCDIGSDKVNDRLSLQRAESVRNYLVGTGAVPADATLVIGKGKREQKYPATPATRAKNRRVELEFFSFVDKEEWVSVPVPAPVSQPAPAPVVYERELIDQPPAWSQRALRSPAQHKREVDTYRFKEVVRTEQRQRGLHPNHDPIAVADTFNVSGETPTTLNVLANDSDPDGDRLSIVSTSQPSPASGAVQIIGDRLLFTPSNKFMVDSFRYTISDGKGGTSTTTVLLVDP